MHVFGFAQLTALLGTFLVLGLQCRKHEAQTLLSCYFGSHHCPAGGPSVADLGRGRVVPLLLQPGSAFYVLHLKFRIFVWLVTEIVGRYFCMLYCGKLFS